MKKVLITGAAGFIGRHAARLFGSEGWRVAGMDEVPCEEDAWRRWGMSEFHSSAVALDALASRAGKPDLIIHCAGTGTVGYSLTHPYDDYKRNVDTTAAVLEFVRLHAPKAHVLYPSSAAVYGAAVRESLKEQDELKPITPYGAHKKMAEVTRKQPPRPLFTSLKSGMQQLVDAIVAQLDPQAIRLRHHVRRIYPQEGGWRVSLEMNGDQSYDGIIVATPAHNAGELLDGVDRELARNLLEITYSSSVTVTLGYYKQQLAKLPPGFGFLVPRSEGTRMLACTFVHNKFPHRAPADKGILRCFLGGSRDETVLGMNDDEILKTVQHELHHIVKLDSRPIFSRVYRWREAMAQYEPGHIARVAQIEKRVAEIPGLAIAGNAYHGIGVPDCIRSGMEAANLMAQLMPESHAARG